MTDKKPYESTRFIRPEERPSSLDDTALITQEQISRVGKREEGGWRVFFAGDPQTIEELAKNAYIVSSDTVYKLNDSDRSFVKDVRKRISDQNAEFDAVVFCTPPEDVAAFRRKGFTFENRFYPPVVYFSDTPIESDNKRLLNVWHVDTKGKDMVLLKHELVEAINAGKKFVDFVKKASLLIMAKNPEVYADLKIRNPDTVLIVPATEEGYNQAKAYLDSTDIVLGGRAYHGKGVFIGGVAIDGLENYQFRLSSKLDNESHLKGIPFAYIGNDPPRHILGQFERCMPIPGGDIERKGLMRLLENYDPSKKREQTKVNVHFQHDGILRGKGMRSLTTRFEPVDPSAETQEIDYEQEDPELLERLKKIAAEVEAEIEQGQNTKDEIEEKELKRREFEEVYADLAKFG